MEQYLQTNGKEIEDNNKESGRNKVYARRVGSVTFGLMLICYGVLFLVHIFVPELPYHVIFRCWPVCFILLGIEILVENYRSRNGEYRFRYDVPAVFMLGGMLLFAMVMAAADVAFTYGNYRYW
ncbi:MAG: hypothetical protein J6A08_04385 [Lachnospiraceae bacterium]|nr:hypothetical protein [Lachnospiraceae bacterium]